MTTRLGRTLRDIREEREMSQTQVSNVTGICRTIISRWESGRRDTPALATLRQYVERMDLKDTELVRLGVAAIQPHERTDNTLRRTTE